MAETLEKSNPDCVEGKKRTLRYLLEETDAFVVCVELVNSRGVITERRGSRVLDLARALAGHPGVHALSITDNPGGNATNSPDTMGVDLLGRGQEVIIHVSCKDWNRNALLSRGWELASEGFENVLALSGDYPASGYHGQAGGVFDTDSVGLLKMFSDMNSGMRLEGGRGDQVLRPTRFFTGAVVNNHKRYEREVMPQYFKLAKKIRNGAGFIINQIGFDARKQDELLKYMARSGLRTPAIANVYVLSPASARFFHAGNIPGVIVTDALLELTQKHARSRDRGKAFFLEFAAKQCAIARGLGYRGVYLGGHLKFEDYARILEILGGYGDGDWRDFVSGNLFRQPEEFYFFEPDEETGLSSDEVSRHYLQSKQPEVLRAARSGVSASYRINRFIHEHVFEKDRPAFRIGRKFFEAVDRAGSGVRGAVHVAEQAVKIPGFDCRDCGDCSLPDIAFLCPESQCVKNQRNGPCGGTRRGLCEVGEKECIWSLAYERLKAYGEEEAMLDGPVVFRNGALKGTSAWANAFLERDHHARRE
ncbi:MAG: methylenetetrahydrofolate reductase C-terminal domain-containing protein [Gemmatimonadota bacterium]|nr:methylenetetrahydrofolate reductase C-terminal domain-containing protein [Gemmatimonadota bacterium]